MPTSSVGGCFLAGMCVHTCLERCLSLSNMRAGHVRVCLASFLLWGLSLARQTEKRGWTWTETQDLTLSGGPEKVLPRDNSHVARVRFRSIVAMCIVSSPGGVLDLVTGTNIDTDRPVNVQEHVLSP